jgi:uncharacterized membrane protein
MLGFWVAAILVGAWLLRHWRWSEQRPQDPALDVLRVRYAKGAIARDEFEANTAGSRNEITVERQHGGKRHDHGIPALD